MHLYVVDLSYDVLEFASRKQRAFYVQADISKIPFRSNSFDLKVNILIDIINEAK